VWAYRKAAWAIEDTPHDLGLVYRQMGAKGLESIENVGPKLAGVVENLLGGLLARSTKGGTTNLREGGFGQGGLL
jgi:hypothetical protein